MKNSDLWAGIVGNAAEALRHPGLTAAIRNLHPGIMPAASEPPKQMGIAGYADGGSVMPPGMMGDPGGTPDPSMPDSSDPRMEAIADAEDALGTIESGGTMQPEHIAALHTFNNTYGPTALGHLHANVRAGMRMRRASTPRVVVGAHGKDKVPALVDGVHQAKLTTGEFVMPTDAVAGAGGGDPVAGAQKLQQLSVMLAAQKPAAAAKPLTPAGIDQRAMPVQSMQPPLPGADMPPALNVDRVQ